MTGAYGATWFTVESPSFSLSTTSFNGTGINFGALDLVLEGNAELPNFLLDQTEGSLFSQIELATYVLRDGQSELVADDGVGNVSLRRRVRLTMVLPPWHSTIPIWLRRSPHNRATGDTPADTLVTGGWNAATQAADSTPAYAAAAPSKEPEGFIGGAETLFCSVRDGRWQHAHRCGRRDLVCRQRARLYGIRHRHLHQFSDLSFSFSSNAILPALLEDIASGQTFAQVELAGYVGDTITSPLTQDDIFGQARIDSLSSDANGTISLSLSYSSLQEESALQNAVIGNNSLITENTITTAGWDTATDTTLAAIPVAAAATGVPLTAASTAALTYYVQIKETNGDILTGTDGATWFAVSDVASGVSNNGTGSAGPAFDILSFTLPEGTELPAIFLDEAQNTEIGQIELAGYVTTTGTYLATDDLFDNGYFTYTDNATVGSSASLAFTYEKRVEQSYTVAQGSAALDATDGWNKATDAATASPNFAAAAPLDNGPLEVTCFLAGTQILTESRLLPVEALRIGMKVRTLHAGWQPIKWIGMRSYAAPFCNHEKVLPVRICAHAIADNVPARDLFVSPGHAIALDGALIHASRLINGVSITQAARLDEVRYYHIELAGHEVIFAENTQVETFRGEYFRNQFQNAAAFAALYPGDTAPEAACLPVLSHGFQLAAILRRLKSRAGIAQPDVPGPLAGYVDQITPCQIIGWAADCAHRDEPVVLDVLASGRLIGRTIANIARPDVAAAGFGAGYHGFEWDISHAAGPITIRRACDGAELGGMGRVRPSFCEQKEAKKLY